MTEWQTIRSKDGKTMADIPRHRGSIEARMGEDALLYAKLEERWFKTRFRKRIDDGVRMEWKARYCARGLVLLKRWRAVEKTHDVCDHTYDLLRAQLEKRERELAERRTPVVFPTLPQREMMWHALGGEKAKRGKPYRNHYVLGAASTEDVSLWQALVEAGLASKRPYGLDESGASTCFHVTQAGRDVLGCKPDIDAQKPVRKKKA